MQKYCRERSFNVRKQKSTRIYNDPTEKVINKYCNQSLVEYLRIVLHLNMYSVRNMQGYIGIQLKKTLLIINYTSKTLRGCASIKLQEVLTSINTRLLKILRQRPRARLYARILIQESFKSSQAAIYMNTIRRDLNKY